MDKKIVKLKSTLDRLIDEGKVKTFKVDWDAEYERDKKLIDTDKIRYDDEVKIENDRIINLSCPHCRTENKELVNISFRNGPVVYGGRNNSRKLAEYYVCHGCGIMFVDINKKEIKPPYKGRVMYGSRK
jgi:transposase-like protein